MRFTRILNYIYVIIIVVVLIGLLFIYLNRPRERFEEDVKVIFMTKEEVQLFMINDRDDYIKNLSIYDLRARRVSTNDEYKELVIHSCLNFDGEQMEKLKRCSKEAIKHFRNGKDWRFALVSYKYEEGFPHTREDIIFLSPAVINYDDMTLTKTLIHESIHIYQRYNRDEMDEYMIRNGFERVRRRDRGTLVRSNPDLDDFIYRDKNGNEMVAVYNSEYPRSIGDVKMVSSNMEHPFEYMAYEMAENYYKLKMSKYKEL